MGWLARSTVLRWMGLLPILIATANIAVAAPEQAAKPPVWFGVQEAITEVQPLESKGPGGEDLFLGYKTSRSLFGLPYRLTDDGYVVGTRGTQSYLKLSDDKVQAMVAAGQLPSVLPAYSISPLDYAVGHSAWLVPLGVGLMALFSLRKSARRSRAVPLLQTGQLHHRNNRLDDALADYTEAIEIDRRFAVAYYNRGLVLREQGELQYAVADFSKMLALTPKSPMVLLERGSTLSQMGQHKAAIRDYTRLLRLEKSAFGYFTRGHAHAAHGDHARAIKDFSAAITAQPGVAVAFEARARSYEASGKVALAHADRQRASELSEQVVELA